VTTAADDQGGKLLHKWLNEADVIVDALLGTGARLPVKGALAGLIAETGRVVSRRRSARANATFNTPAEPRLGSAGAPVVIAVDCPSGLDCDTGEVDPAVVEVDDTITFAAAKVGQLRFPGAAKLGRLHVAGIGTPPDLEALNAITLELADAPAVRAMLPARPIDGHKGTFGKALVVAGSVNYVGAAALAAGAAYRAGAGWVTVAAPQPVVPMLASQVTEATWLLLPHDMGVLAPGAAEVLREELEPYNVMLLGPGWGQEESTTRFLDALLRPQVANKRAIGFMKQEEGEAEAKDENQLPALVIDADGLNLLAQMEDWPAVLPEGTILTPHPGEMARLCGCERDEIEADRIGAARERAAEWGCVVVLKGAFTVVAAPDGRVMVMPFASSALAAAGTGDVLAGAIAGLRAQGLEPFEAGAAGAYLHGLAGVLTAEIWETPASVIAGDVLDILPEALALVSQAVG
jgi:NAD(P)H-hydrate epimerase